MIISMIFRMEWSYIPDSVNEDGSKFVFCLVGVIELLRFSLDVVGFTSIHMCWSGLEWNLN